jgi:predicted esterase
LLLLVALVVPVAAGCGSSSSRHAASTSLVEERLGRGADEVWIIRPSTPPRSLVVFVHGLGRGETTPVNHRPWLEHLAREGSAVVYPRYERTLGSRGAVRHLVAGVQLALGRLGKEAKKLPLVAIGYSRGGELVVDYAAVAQITGVVPAEVLTVFPAGQDPADPPLDLRTVAPNTRFTILVGDHDTVVDGAGAHQLLRRFEAAGFPAARVSVAVIRSHGGFVATHTSPIEVTPAAKAAFWARADRLVARARAEAAGS